MVVLWFWYFCCLILFRLRVTSWFVFLGLGLFWYVLLCVLMARRRWWFRFGFWLCFASSFLFWFGVCLFDVFLYFGISGFGCLCLLRMSVWFDLVVSLLLQLIWIGLRLVSGWMICVFAGVLCCRTRFLGGYCGLFGLTWWLVALDCLGFIYFGFWIGWCCMCSVCVLVVVLCGVL